MNAFFELEELTVHFGGLTAVDRFSLSLDPGELVGLIGPNGAGKTTAFNMITGFLAPDSGRILLHGEEISRLSAHRIAALGIARTFQNIRLFGEMTVLDNLLAALHHQVKACFLSAVFGFPRYRSEDAAMRKRAEELLSEMNLAHLADQKAGELAYGDQRRLEIARALMAVPKLLLLDEPAAGMNPLETMDLAVLVRMIRDKYGPAVLLIEHDMKFVMQLCERIKVLDYGVTIAEGTPEQIRRHPAVVEAYLGNHRHAVVEAYMGNPRHA